MNASPYKTPFGEMTQSVLPVPVRTAGGRDAFQALLEFAAMHQQVRERRAMGFSPEIDSKSERFALDEVLQLVAERALAITHADGIAIALAEEDAILCRAVAGAIAPDKDARVNPNYGFSGACLSSGKVVRCDDALSDPRVNPDTCRRLGSRSMVAVPLTVTRTVIGLIEAFATDARRFKDIDVRRLDLLSELILAALQPEEEDRMAEISRQVVRRMAPVEPIRREPLPIQASPVKTVSVERVPEIAAPIITEVPDEKVESSPQLELVEIGRDRPRSWTLLIASLSLALLAGALWYSWHQRKLAAAADTSQAAASAVNSVPELSTTPAATAAQTPPRNSSDFANVLDIRHWSSPESSTVVIDLQDQVPYEAHRLSDPDRIYFDLHDSKLDAKLNRSIEVGDRFLLRVRSAELSPGVTRVVLETKASENFSVSLEQNPYRLVVEIRSLNSTPQAHAKVDLGSNPPIAAHATLANPPAPTTKIAAAIPKFRIVLDAGHGGWDLGTVGRHGLLEKDLVLDVVGRLGKLVEKGLGAEVLYTRSDDVYIPLEKRTEIANLSHADLFLSVHANYSDFPSARGVETYYTNTFSSVHSRTSDSSEGVASAGLIPVDINFSNVNIHEKVDESRKFATDIQQSLFHAVAAKSEVPNRGVKEATYVVLTGTTMPAVLTEISFVSSPTDETNLQSSAYRQQLAEALYQGISRYESAHGVKSASSTLPKLH
jgi:N-acetylmuramoyl-L-alanine amidase